MTEGEGIRKSPDLADVINGWPLRVVPDVNWGNGVMLGDGENRLCYVK